MLSKIKKERKNSYSTIDIETDKNGDVLDIAVYDGLETFFFSSWRDYLEWLNENCDEMKYRKFIAHNGGGFDYISLVEFLIESKKYEYEIIMAQSDIIILSICVNKVNIQFFDSAKVFVYSSLDKLSQVFNVDHKKIEVDYDKSDMRKFKKENEKLYFQYLAYDVISLFEVCQSFQKLLNIQYFPATIASLSMYLFRRDFMKANQNLFKPRKAVDDYISNAYTGGRVEVFQASEFEKVDVYDINSLYPSVMLQPMPIGLPKKAYSFHKNKIGVYHIKFNQYDRNIPAVLWRKTGMSLEFVYEGEGYFFTPEIEKAKEIGCNIEIIDGYVWLKSETVFKKFVNHFYNLRQKNQDNALNYICKIILNSLYGKFGQREEKTRLKYFTSHDSVKKLIKNSNVKITQYNEVEGMYKITDCLEVKHRIIQFAAYITSLARIRLYENIDTETIYCDTDSIHTASKFSGKISNQLGDWKLEATGKGIYVARKGYMINDLIKFKGMKVKDRLKSDEPLLSLVLTLFGYSFSLLTFQDYQQILKGAKLEKSYHTFPKIKSIISEKNKACKIISMKKTLQLGKYLTNFKNPKRGQLLLKNYNLYDLDKKLNNEDLRLINQIRTDLEGWKGYNNNRDFTPVQDEKPEWLGNDRKHKVLSLLKKAEKNNFKFDEDIEFRNLIKKYKKENFA